MFDKKLRDRITELEAQNADLETARKEDTALHDGIVDALTARHKAELERIARERAAADEAFIKLMRSRDLEKARLEGEIEALRTQGERHEVITRRHSWHTAGSTFAHGQKLLLWECLECRNDPTANSRLLLPEGVSP